MIEKMAASRDDIGAWFDRGVVQNSTHMIVVCDGFDYEDYPVFVGPEMDVDVLVAEYQRNTYQTMQRVMEVYNLSMDKATQLQAPRAFNT